MDTSKRKAGGDLAKGDDKRAKTKKQWQVPRKNGRPRTQASLQQGDSGIWATCTRGKESKCVMELYDLFQQYAEQIYAEQLPTATSAAEADSIENDIQAELAEMRSPQTAKLFTSVNLNVQCVVFFKTIAPIEPVEFVQRLCEDASKYNLSTKTRFAQRLTPMTLIGHGSLEGLDKVARQVLAPLFHGEPRKPQKYAIRPNMRNHHVSSRDAVIKQVASIVGPGHKVDLHNYDALILVEFYQNLCGVSVVTGAYEKLRRFNLAELAQIDQDPLPLDSARPKSDDARGVPPSHAASLATPADGEAEVERE